MILFYKQDAAHFVAEKLLLDSSYPGEVEFADKVSGREEVIVVGNREDGLEVNFSRPTARVVLLAEDTNAFAPDDILEIAKGGVSYFANRDDVNEIVGKVLTAYSVKKNLSFYIRQEQALIMEVKDHKIQLEGLVNFHMVGKSPAIMEVLKEIKLVSQYSGKGAPDILVRGEQGVGKEVVVNTLRDNLVKAKAGFNVMTMGGVNPSLLASTLFGHVKGAFTGAIDDKVGMFAASNGKVLYIDEIAELPLDTQAMLLRAIEYREYTEVGSNKVKYFDAQLITATNQPLEKLVAKGEFREDLYNRLHDMVVRMPPLRVRKEDIPFLVQHFLGIKNENHPSLKKDISTEAVHLMSAMDWAGNVRELKNFISRAHILEPTKVISVITVAGIIQKEALPEISKARSNMEMLRDVAEKFNIDLTKPIHATAVEMASSRQLSL